MPEKKKVSFLATMDNRRQNRDGEWKIVLEAPMTETPNVDKLSPYFSECVVKVTVELQDGSDDGKDNEQAES